MAQNIFMTSMYFFVPINKVRLSNMYKLISHPFQHIECSPLFQTISSDCSYAGLNDKHQNFYFNTVVGKKEPRERMVQAKVYIIKYIPSVSDKYNVKYFLAIGVGIDKVFCKDNDITNPNDYCTENDLVMLKRAFYSNNDKSREKQGLYYPQHDSTIFHRDWLNGLVNELDKEPSSIIKFDASITDICAVTLDSTSSITDRKSLKNLFEDNYYYATYHSYDKALTGVDVDKLVYGILVGNENYIKLPNDMIAAFNKESYSNCLSERIFTVSNSILFLRTHYPHVEILDYVDSSLSMSFLDLDSRNIYELCHSLYLKGELTAISKQVNNKSKPGTVKEAADKLTYLQKTQLFNLYEADKRMDVILLGVGVTKQSKETNEYVQTYLSNKRFSYSRKQNNWMKGLTIVTIFLGIASLFVNLWKEAINQYFDEYIYWGDIKYQRWVAYVYLIINILFVFGMFRFLSKLKDPFDMWLSKKLDNFFSNIHKKAAQEE